MRKNTAPAIVSVKLLCVYCGDGESANPGDVIHVDLKEAERLFDLKAAILAGEAVQDSEETV